MMVSIITLHFKVYFVLCTKLAAKFAWEQKLYKILSEIHFTYKNMSRLHKGKGIVEWLGGFPIKFKIEIRYFNIGGYHIFS